MTQFISFYKGASLFEVHAVKPSEGEAMDSKIIAKAVSPEQENMRIEFTATAGSQEKALQRIRKTIDDYLTEHETDSFKKKSFSNP